MDCGAIDTLNITTIITNNNNFIDIKNNNIK